MSATPAVRVTCPTCGAKLNAPAAAAGRHLPCPRCGDTVPVSGVVPKHLPPPLPVPPRPGIRDVLSRVAGWKAGLGVVCCLVAYRMIVSWVGYVRPSDPPPAAPGSVAEAHQQSPAPPPAALKRQGPPPFRPAPGVRCYATLPGSKDMNLVFLADWLSVAKATKLSEYVEATDEAGFAQMLAAGDVTWTESNPAPVLVIKVNDPEPQAARCRLLVPAQRFPTPLERSLENLEKSLDRLGRQHRDRTDRVEWNSDRTRVIVRDAEIIVGVSWLKPAGG